MPGNNKNFTSIPMIDMRDSEQLYDACHHTGFFYLMNHGVPPDLMNKILSLSEQFFALPQNEKNQIDIAFSNHFRGYGKLEAEITLGIPDYKETYDLGLERQPIADAEKQSHLTLIGPNQWPESVSLKQVKFKETMLEYINCMQELGNQLMQRIATTLSDAHVELAEKFNPDATDAFAMLRLLHYPPTDHTTLGVGPHIDSGCLILLLQDEVGGLQVQNNNGTWIDVPPIPNTFVINLGEMLQIWSRGQFKATLHRVINQSGRRRLSAPFFFEPNLATIITEGSETPVYYGERMLEVFKRSFDKNKRAT